MKVYYLCKANIRTPAEDEKSSENYDYYGFLLKSIELQLRYSFFYYLCSKSKAMIKILNDLISRGVVTKEELLLVDNLKERLAMIAESNRLTEEFLKTATDEDYKMMFSECGKISNVFWQEQVNKLAIIKYK